MILNKFQYVRISIIDSCNLRCKFCNPYGSSIKKMRGCISPEDIRDIVSLFITLNTSKVRITGGEPLLRGDIVDIIKAVASFDEIKDICLTTNGILLERYLASLVEAGLMRVNISLPSLNEIRYRELTGGSLKRVTRGIDSALKMGLYVKINVVAYGDEILNELDGFIDFIAERDVFLRFIEYMPVCTDIYNKKKFIESRILENILVSRYGFEVLVSTKQMVNSIYQRNDIRGKIGFIRPVSSQFCDICNKVRINCYGEVRPCLFSRSGINILKLLRSEGPNNTRELIIKFVSENFRIPEINKEIDQNLPPEIGLSEIGG